jgi:hypothetical protein
VDKPRINSWPLDLALGLLPFTLVAEVLVWVIYLPLGLNGFADFRQLYTGGYIIRTGNAALLYDFDAQTRFQHQLFPDASQMVLLITHPAFEELIFVPLSLLPYKSAFSIFFAINVAALSATLYLLWPRIYRLHERWKWAPILLVASFFPISRALLQGQDSILLLLLLSAVLVLGDREQYLLAGLILGLGLFRFQIILPIALLFLLWRKFRFVAGFLISAASAVLVSVWVVGVHAGIMFLRYMLSLSVNLNSPTSMAKYRDTPLEMLNLRGLLSAVFWDKLPHLWIEGSILIASLLVIAAAWKTKPSLPLAIVAATLVSYHFIAHDASIWLIPIFCALCGPSISEGLLGVAMLLSPFIAAFLFEGIRSHAYLASLPLLGLFLLKVCRRAEISGTNDQSETSYAANNIH